MPCSLAVNYSPLPSLSENLLYSEVQWRDDRSLRPRHFRILHPSFSFSSQVKSTDFPAEYFRNRLGKLTADICVNVSNFNWLLR